jgi:transcriptional regulator with XRE-family HTH domain
VKNLRVAFAETLRALREKSKVSQETLGNETELSRTYIGELERALKEPSLLTIFRICEVLGIKPSEFVAQIEKRLKKNH